MTLRAQLAAERAALVEGSDTTISHRAPVELDQASVGRFSRMDVMQQQAMAVAAERRRAASLQRIDAALRRIERADYGWCAECCEPIALARLALDPAAPLCVGCAGALGRR